MSVIVRFGPFELDRSTAELHRNGRKMRLPEQQFQILEMLLRGHGNLVSREEIRKRLWPNDTIVEFDRSINAAIKKLRAALEDSADTPRFIETVARRGYRILVEVQFPEGSPPADPVRKTVDGSLVGQRVSHYRVLSLLGGGGMGLVYKAEDLKLNRPVALKFLPDELASNPEAIQRFEREARAASALNHPNICTIHGIEEHETHPFIVMELLEGQSLSELISRYTPGSDAGSCLPLEQLLEVGIQIADGLAAAHQKGIIHRDIKPANIFVTRHGQAKVLDFGLAEFVGSPQPVRDCSETISQGPTELGAVVGTLDYMSPEQLRGMDLDARTDLFSFGAVLYQMVTGVPPFRSETSAMTYDAILNRAPVPPVRSNPKMPARLEETILKALEKDRNQRYQHASEMESKLKRLKQETERTGAISGTDSEARKTLWWRGKVAISAAVSSVAVASAIVVGVFHSNQRADKDGPIDSVAVMPIVANGKDQSAQLLSDGITDSLIDGLSRAPDLKVMSRSSVFHYKGREADPQAVGRELKVKAVLTGTLVEQDDNLFLSTELVRVSDNSHVWGEQYTRKISDILPLQSELARTISEKLRLRLSGEQRQKLLKQGTQNPEAYAFYVRGRNSFDRFTVESLRDSVTLFQRAIDKDPNYAAAYAELARTYVLLGNFHYLPGKDAYPKAIDAARRSIALDDTVAEGHVALGDALSVTWNFAAAQQELQRAIDLAPNLSWAHLIYGYNLAAIGRLADAIRELTLAHELDPLFVGPINLLGLTYYFQRNYDKSLEQWQKSMTISPTSPIAHRNLFYVYVGKGIYDKAVAELRLQFQLEGRTQHARTIEESYTRGGYQEALRTMIQIGQHPASEDYDPFAVAAGYSFLHDKNQAFVWLSKALEANSYPVVYLKVDPIWDNIRSDPRFEELVRRIGLPE